LNENAKPKIFVATIHYKNSPFEFASTLSAIIRQMTLDGIFSHSYAVGSAEIDRNRNDCVEMFLKTDATHLLFLDDDMQFPPDVASLLARHNKPIVSGLYFQRALNEARPHLYAYEGVITDRHGEETHSFMPLTAKIWDLTKDVPKANKPMFIDNPELVFPIDMGGNGCLLIERSVFEKVPYPWFRSVGGNNGDVVFFTNCMKAGIEMIGDAGIICTHQALVWFGLGSFYETYARRMVNRDNNILFWDNWWATNSLVTTVYENLDTVIDKLLDMSDVKPKVFINYACGVNDIHRHLSNRDDVLLKGIDFSIEALDINKRKHPEAEWIKSDVLFPVDGIEPFSADIVMCLNMIDAMEEPQRLLDIMWNVLKTGGILVVGTKTSWDNLTGLMKKYGLGLNVFALPDINICAVRKGNACSD
jgi:hypothetical protein